MASPQEIKAALERASSMVTLKPAIGQRVYTNVGVLETGLVCRTEEKGHVIVADLHPPMGGENLGPSPAAIFRAALSSCIALGVKMWAARRDLPVGRIEVGVETDVDARGQFGVCDDVAPGFGALRLDIRVESDADPKLVRDVVDQSLRLSPLMDAITRPQAITTQVEIKYATRNT